MILVDSTERALGRTFSQSGAQVRSRMHQSPRRPSQLLLIQRERSDRTPRLMGRSNTCDGCTARRHLNGNRLLLLPHVNRPWLRLLHLGQCQGEHAILHSRLRSSPDRSCWKAGSSCIVPDVVFDIERAQALILRQIKSALDMKHVFLHADTDVGFLETPGISRNPTSVSACRKTYSLRRGNLI